MITQWLIDEITLGACIKAAELDYAYVNRVAPTH